MISFLSSCFKVIVSIFDWFSLFNKNKQNLKSNDLAKKIQKKKDEINKKIVNSHKNKNLDQIRKDASE